MNFHTVTRFAACALLALAPQAHAITTMPTSSSYTVTHNTEVAATPAAVFTALGEIDKWWSSDHTYSGKAQNLKIEMRGGGCFCETWEGGSVEHARVVAVLRDRLLRLEGGLGPLQDRAVTAILSFTITPAGDRTKLLVVYRIRAAEGALENTAEGVDRVIGEQVKRLTTFIERK